MMIKLLASRITRTIASLVVLAVVATLVVVYVVPHESGHRITADFSRSTGLYTGDDVKILGVTVGSVESITPHPGHVTITFTVKDGVRLPAGVEAAIVAPSLVSGRFIQLAPAYSGSGPTYDMAQPIPQSRTAVPVEWNDLETQLTRLATALGPTRSDTTGALSRVLTTVDSNLHGNAADLNASVRALASAAGTVSSSRGDLFKTVTSLNAFITALNANDASVRSFSGQLSNASALLSNNDAALGKAFSSLDDAVVKVTKFLQTNRTKFATALKSTRHLSGILASHNYDLAQTLHVGATAFANFYNLIDPTYQTFIGDFNLTNFANISDVVCKAIIARGGVVDTCLKVLTPLLTSLHLNSLSLQLSQELKNLFGNTNGASTATPSSTSTSSAAPPTGGSSSSTTTSADPSSGTGLGGKPSTTAALLQLLIPAGTS